MPALNKVGPAFKRLITLNPFGLNLKKPALPASLSCFSVPSLPFCFFLHLLSLTPPQSFSSFLSQSWCVYTCPPAHLRFTTVLGQLHVGIFFPADKQGSGSKSLAIVFPGLLPLMAFQASNPGAHSLLCLPLILV